MRSSELHDKFRKIRVEESFDENHRTRLHRAISWLKCAEKYSKNNDPDIAVIALWISFNSCYSIDDYTLRAQPQRNQFLKFAKTLITFDNDLRIYEILLTKYPEEVMSLICNKYVYQLYWEAKTGGDLVWDKPFAASKRRARQAIKDENTTELLSIIFDRLYCLRNQLFHGGATYESKVNRDQIHDAMGILLDLVPVIIELMFKKENWGNIYYPNQKV